MLCTREMADAAWERFRQVALRKDLDTRDKVIEAVNAALSKLVEAPRDAIFVESRVSK